MTIFLVRHAKAGDRQKWEGPDRLRPLSKKGWAQAHRLPDLLGDRGIRRVVSSPYVRCVQTVEPLAQRLALKVEEDGVLAEGAGPEALVGLVRGLASTPTALCTHGDVVPTLLEALVRVDGVVLPPDYPCTKGSTWVLETDDRGHVLTADYLPAP